MSVRELLREGIERTARAVRASEVSCREVVDAVLEVAGATEDVYHAYATLAPESARVTADLLDLELRSTGPRGPLHGIPVSLKDSICTIDLPTEGGSRALAGWRPSSDAAVVRKIRSAGAVVVGKTVMHEFGFGQNRIPTRSAVSASMFPGGSSAGSAVSVALGSAGVSIGTDAGGSSRIPAAYNGIVGLKPTYGRISRDGVIRCSPALDHMGQLTRSVADSRLLLSVLAGADPADPATSWQLHGDRRQTPSLARRVGIVAELNEGTDPEVRRVTAEAIALLAERGVEIVELPALPIAEMAVATGTILQSEGAASHAALLRDRGDRYVPETRWVIQAGMLQQPGRYEWALGERVRLQRIVRDVYDAAGIVAVLCPTVPRHRIDNDVAERVEDPADPDSLDQMVRNTTFANLLGLPALSVPTGIAADGTPVSMQLVGRPLAEAELFVLGEMLERRDEARC